MQILASALPGFRDLRAPLTAGYLWLIFLWIALRPNLTTRPTNEIAAALWDLGKATGPVWITLAVGLVAYLIGSVSQISSPALGGAMKFIWNRSEQCLDWLRKFKLFKWIPLLPVSQPISPLNRYYEDAVAGVRYSNRNNSDLADHAETYVAHLAEEAAPKIERDVSLPSALLLAEESLLFTETDRLKAERQFRLAIAPPLTAVVFYLWLNVSTWWLVALLPLTILLWQSHMRQLEYNQLMYAAIERGSIASDSVEMFRKLAEPDPADY